MTVYNRQSQVTYNKLTEEYYRLNIGWTVILHSTWNDLGHPHVVWFYFQVLWYFLLSLNNVQHKSQTKRQDPHNCRNSAINSFSKQQRFIVPETDTINWRLDIKLLVNVSKIQQQPIVNFFHWLNNFLCLKTYSSVQHKCAWAKFWEGKPADETKTRGKNYFFITSLSHIKSFFNEKSYYALKWGKITYLIWKYINVTKSDFMMYFLTLGKIVRKYISAAKIFFQKIKKISYSIFITFFKSWFEK